LISVAAATAATMLPPPPRVVSNVNCAELENTAAENTEGTATPQPAARASAP
jgi:hypothetical protein